VTRLREVVQEMIGEKLLAESLDGTECSGRSPVPLSANPDHGCFGGLDFEAQRYFDKLFPIESNGSNITHETIS
jgi:hypothetical protein